jgi:hypothetical protein
MVQIISNVDPTVIAYSLRMEDSPPPFYVQLLIKGKGSKSRCFQVDIVKQGLQTLTETDYSSVGIATSYGLNGIHLHLVSKSPVRIHGVVLN